METPKGAKVTRRRRQIRGEKLILAMKAELGRMVNLSADTDPISVSALAKRLKISRQTIYSNDLKATVEEFAQLQKSNTHQEVEASLKRRPLEDRIKALQQENGELRTKLDSYLEQWVAVEYNARMLGVDAEALFAPIGKPLRSIRRL